MDWVRVFSYAELLHKYVSCFIAVVMMSNELRAIGLSLTFILNYCLLCLFQFRSPNRSVFKAGISSTLWLEDEEKESGLFSYPQQSSPFSTRNKKDNFVILDWNFKGLFFN